MANILINFNRGKGYFSQELARAGMVLFATGCMLSKIMSNLRIWSAHILSYFFFEIGIKYLSFFVRIANRPRVVGLTFITS